MPTPTKRPPGRPPLGAAKRSTRVEVRVSPAELEQIDALAAEAGEDRAAYVRRRALGE